MRKVTEIPLIPKILSASLTITGCVLAGQGHLLGIAFILLGFQNIYLEINK